MGTTSSVPGSNGRADFHASRLSAVLFGSNARCVSFLSTSVRSSPTPNLLAQPLNDLSAARIFDAIANLTGLDRELEQEQALRSKEHEHRVKVLDAERDLETWQREIAIVEAGISQRRGARDQLGTSRAAWQTRCARHLMDGLERADQVRSAIKDLDLRTEQLSGELLVVNGQIDALSDDGEFARRLEDTKARRAEIGGRDQALDTEHQVTAHRLEELSAQHRQLVELARAADGRTQEVAEQEREAAQEELEGTLAGKGAADAAEQQARRLFDAAESGQDLASAQLHVLSQAGLPAAALLDVADLEDAQRPVWEPGLTLYRDAEDRARAADAAEQAGAVSEEVSRLRKENMSRLEQRELLRPALLAAEDDYAKALGAAHARDETLTNLRGARARLQASLRAVEAEKTGLTAERDGMNLTGRQSEWGESDDAARRHLLALDDIQQRRTTAEWNEEACQALNDAVRRCFPDATPAEEMPAEIRELLVEQRWQRGGLDVRVRLTPALLRALRTHLNLTEQHDSYQQAQISAQRAERHADLATARLGLAEAEQTSHAHRSSLALGIKNTLRQVAQAFDELDQAYGGYGAGLDYPEPEPPAEPDRPWQWTVAPKWRRAEGQRMGSYNLKANTAQIDEKAAKLVCAAALAAGGDRPLVLILDELGRNLGKQHRREAVALFERIGRDRNITVIGALQDDMERYALEASGLYIKLRRSSDAIAYNEPPVVVGDEASRGRVELLAESLSSYRPAAGITDPGSEPDEPLMDFG